MTFDHFSTIENALKTIEQAQLIARSNLMLCPVGTFIFALDMHRVRVSSLEELHEVRAFLREHVGWRDALDHIFSREGHMTATYKPVNQAALPVPFVVWLTMPAEEFPIDAISPGCRIELHGSTVQEATIICDKN